MRRLHWILTGLLLSITACAQPTTDTVDAETDENTSAITIGSAITDADDHDLSAHAHAHAGPTDHSSGQELRSSRHQAKHSGHGGHAAVKRTDGLAIGEVVPNFEVSIDGKPQTLSQLRKNKDITEDGTLVMTFWCSFCHSCRDVEMDLNELAEKYAGTAGVIAIDASAGETTKGIAEFAKKKGLTLPIAITNGAVADLFGIRVTTTTVVIDSKGVLRYCGQFADQQHSYAADALAAVLSDSDVAVPETAHRG
jgi:thiol-disulfide isomerase/thioredoxin